MVAALAALTPAEVEKFQVGGRDGVGWMGLVLFLLPFFFWMRHRSFLTQPEPTTNRAHSLRTLQEEGKLTVAGFELVGEELILKKEFKGDASVYQARWRESERVCVSIDVDMWLYVGDPHTTKPTTNQNHSHAHTQTQHPPKNKP